MTDEAKKRAKAVEDGKRLPKETRFQKGRSGNPSGRPPRSAFIHGFLDMVTTVKGAKLPRERRMVMLEALFEAAADTRHRDFMKAQELLMAYDFGKPAQRVEMSGPGGAPIESKSTTTVTDIRRLTSEQVRKRLEATRLERDRLLGEQTPIVEAVADEEIEEAAGDTTGDDADGSAPQAT